MKTGSKYAINRNHKRFEVAGVSYQVNKELCKAFGARVRELREEKGISMRTFASLAEMEYSQLSRIELGQLNTSISSAYAISQALQIPLKKLLDFNLED